jgi:hypothetical protein
MTTPADTRTTLCGWTSANGAGPNNRRALSKRISIAGSGTVSASRSM